MEPSPIFLGLFQRCQLVCLLQVRAIPFRLIMLLGRYQQLYMDPTAVSCKSNTCTMKSWSKFLTQLSEEQTEAWENAGENCSSLCLSSAPKCLPEQQPRYMELSFSHDSISERKGKAKTMSCVLGPHTQEMDNCMELTAHYYIGNHPTHSGRMF